MTAVTSNTERSSPQSGLCRDQVRGHCPHLTHGAVEGPSTQGCIVRSILRSYDFTSGCLPSVPQGVVSGCPPLFVSVITVFSCRGSLVWASWEGGNYILPHTLSQQLPVSVTKPSTDLCPSLCRASDLEIVWTVVGSG